MITNATITAYLSSNNYAKKELECFWQDIKQSTLNSINTVSNAKTIIRIPYTEDIVFTEGKDIIIKGSSSLSIDVTNDDTFSSSVDALMKAGGRTVLSYSEKLYGSKEMQHYEVSA